MGIAIHELLKLEATENFKLVAGLGGVNRKVSSVGIVDSEEIEMLPESLLPGEFLITNFLIIRESPELITEYIRGMVNAQSACLAIKATYFNEIPHEAMALANEHQFPVFIFTETYIDTLVIDINNALNRESNEKRLNIIIQDLIEHNLNEFRINELARDLNRNFQKNFVVCYLMENEEIKDEFKLTFNITALNELVGINGLVAKYKSGYLVIYSNESKHGSTIKDMMKSILNLSGVSEKNYKVGISNPKQALGHLGIAISESIYAYSFTIIEKTAVAEFENIGIYQVLMPLANNEWVHSYCTNIIGSLLDYDSDHGTELLETAIAYINNDGDIQKTAEVLYQHGNTVRYRIRKIAKLQGATTMKGFVYETLSVAIRWHLINKR